MLYKNECDTPCQSDYFTDYFLTQILLLSTFILFVSRTLRATLVARVTIPSKVIVVPGSLQSGFA